MRRSSSRKHQRASDKLWISGFHSVRSMLQNRPEQVDLLVLSGKHPGHRLLVALARENDIPFTKNIERVPESLRRQKNPVAFARLSSAPYAALDEILQQLEDDDLFIILDHLQDPTNLGNILRSAAAVGVKAILTPKHRGVRLTPVVSKIASGALAFVKICRYGSLQHTIERMQEKGIWVVAADPFAPDPWYTLKTSGPLALVIGHEGKGITRTVLQLCNQTVSIPMKNIESLNAATTTAVLLFEIVHQRHLSDSSSR